MSPFNVCLQDRFPQKVSFSLLLSRNSYRVRPATDLTSCPGFSSDAFRFKKIILLNVLGTFFPPRDTSVVVKGLTVTDTLNYGHDTLTNEVKISVRE